MVREACWISGQGDQKADSKLENRSDIRSSSLPTFLRLPREIQHQIFSLVMEIDLEHTKEDGLEIPYETTQIHHISKSLAPLCSMIRYSTMYLPENGNVPDHLVRLESDSRTSNAFRPRLENVSRLFLGLSSSNFHIASLALPKFEYLTHLSLNFIRLRAPIPALVTTSLAYLPNLTSLRMESTSGPISTAAFQDETFKISTHLPKLKHLHVDCALANLLFVSDRPRLSRLTICDGGELQDGRVPWTTVDHLCLDLANSVEPKLHFEMVDAFRSVVSICIPLRLCDPP
jgi:hypothetical protein